MKKQAATSRWSVAISRAMHSTTVIVNLILSSVAFCAFVGTQAVDRNWSAVAALLGSWGLLLANAVLGYVAGWSDHALAIARRTIGDWMGYATDEGGAPNAPPITGRIVIDEEYVHLTGQMQNSSAGGNDRRI